MTGVPKIRPYPIPTTEELVRNVAHWEIDLRGVVLLVHDMQRFFLRTLPPEMANMLISNVSNLIEWARIHTIPVAYTAQPGRMTQQQRGLLRDFWGVGMRSSSQDFEIEDDCMARQEDWKFTKWHYSAFFKTDLLNVMRQHCRSQLIICGLYAHVGVLTTAVDAFSHEIETFIISDAVADFSREDHLYALNYAARTCACVMSVNTILNLEYLGV